MQDDFDRHWREADMELPKSKLSRARKFLGPLLNHAVQNRKQKMILLDAGCGDGVHAKILNEQLPSIKGQRLAIDITSVALTQLQRFAPGWEVIQSDITRLPLADDSVDAAFSYGAIAYTANPALAVSEICRVTAPGGFVGLWCAPPPQGISKYLLDTTRKVCIVGGWRVTRFMANMIVPLLHFLPTASGLTLGNASWRQCREVVLVNIAPSTLIFPTRNEILGWLDVGGVSPVPEDKTAPHTVWGQKLLRSQSNETQSNTQRP